MGEFGNEYSPNFVEENENDKFLTGLEKREKIGSGNYKEVYKTNNPNFVILELKEDEGTKSREENYLAIYDYLKRHNISTYDQFQEAPRKDGDPIKFVADNLTKDNSKVYSDDPFGENTIIDGTKCPTEIIDKLNNIAQNASKNGIIIPNDGYFFTVKDKEIKNVLVGDFDTLVIDGITQGMKTIDYSGKDKYKVNQEKVDSIIVGFLDRCESVGIEPQERNRISNSSIANMVREFRKKQ